MVKLSDLFESWRARHPAHFRVRNYLRRWYLFPVKSWVDTHVGNIYLHRFEDSDLPVPHDHPYCNASLILAGKYLEHSNDGASWLRRPGRLVLRSKHMLHWLEIIDGPVWTLFLHGPRRREWGFQTRQGWVHHAEYTEKAGRV